MGHWVQKHAGRYAVKLRLMLSISQYYSAQYNKKLRARRLRLTRYVPPACKNPTHSFIAGRDSWQRMLHWRTNSEVRRWSEVPFSRYDTVSVLAGTGSWWLRLSAIRVFELRLWPLIWGALLFVAHRGVDNLPTNFGLPTFRSRLIGQHLSDASRDLATLTFDLEGHCAYRWCGSSYCVCVKFEVHRPSRSEDIGHLLCEH